MVLSTMSSVSNLTTKISGKVAAAMIAILMALGLAVATPVFSGQADASSWKKPCGCYKTYDPDVVDVDVGNVNVLNNSLNHNNILNKNFNHNKTILSIL